jgi:hypothetical protein
MTTEPKKRNDRRTAYRGVSVPFVVLAVVFFLSGEVGIGASFIAIGTVFLVTGGSDGRQDEQTEDT